MPVLNTDSSTATPSASAMPTQLVNITSSTSKPLDWETQLTKTVTKFIIESSTTCKYYIYKVTSEVELVIKQCKLESFFFYKERLV